MSIGRDMGPAQNPNVCSDPYAPSFWLGKPGALTQIRTPNMDYSRDLNDHFGVHDLLDGQAVDRSPYQCRTWTFDHEWLRPEVETVFMEFATRQRGFGPFILVDPHAKNLLTPNQASGTDSLHTSEGFSVTGTGDVLSSSTGWSQQGERSLLWQQIVPQAPANTQVYDVFTRTTINGWNTTTSGHTWTSTGGSATDYGVSGTDNMGFQQNTSANVMRSMSIPTDKNAVFGADTLFTVSVATGATYRSYVQGRYTDQSNFYAVEFALTTGGVFTYQLVKFVAGVRTTLSSLITVPGLYTARNTWRAEIYTVGTAIKARVYRTTEARPTAWTFDVIDSSLTTGGLSALSSRIDTSGTGSPFMYFDNAAANFAHGGGLTLVPPTGLYGWCLPPGATYAFSGVVRGFAAADAAITITPRIVMLNSVGGQVSIVNGTAINTVTGSSTSFCLTGAMPQVSGGTFYASPQFIVSDASVTDQSGVYIDQLQLELTLTGQCTQWEYGQGQPLVAVRSTSEVIPRVLRTNMSYVCVEVT